MTPAVRQQSRLAGRIGGAYIDKSFLLKKAGDHGHLNDPMRRLICYLENQVRPQRGDKGD